MAAAGRTGSAAMGKIGRAHQLFREGRHEEALEFYTEALAMAKTKSQRIALHSNRAACYLKLHNFRKAADECSSVLELDHQHTGALMLRAQTLVKLKEYQSALFDVNILMELNPSSDAYKNLQTNLRTQLSLAPIPESEEETYEEKGKNDDNHKTLVSAKVLHNNIKPCKKSVQSTACSRIVEPDVDKKNKKVMAKSTTKTVVDEHVNILNEKVKLAVDNKASKLPRKVPDAQVENTSDDSKSAEGVCIMLKKNNGNPEGKYVEKSELIVAQEGSKMKKMDTDNTRESQNKNSELLVAGEANMVSNKNVSPTGVPKQSELTVKTVMEDKIEDPQNMKNDATMIVVGKTGPENIADNLPGAWNQKGGVARDKEVNLVQIKNENLAVAHPEGSRTTPKPKGHSSLDYSRWDHVVDDLSDDEDDKEEEQPRYRFRVRNIGVRSVK